MRTTLSDDARKMRYTRQDCANRSKQNNEAERGQWRPGTNAERRAGENGRAPKGVRSGEGRVGASRQGSTQNCRDRRTARHTAGAN